MALRAGPSRRSPSTRSPCAAWRERPTPPVRRSFTTARDFVLNSESREPHDEDVRPSPRGVYASSKLLGEWFALEAPRAYVLRVESLFGSPAEWTGRRGTLDHIVDGLQQGREVKVFTDRIVSPSYSKDVAAATRHLVTSRRASRPLSLRQRRPRELARRRRGSGGDSRRAGRAWCRSRVDQCRCVYRVRATARSRRRSWRPRDSRCRRGRMRCADGSRLVLADRMTAIRMDQDYDHA